MAPVDTDLLIDRLAASATPVRPLAPAWRRAAGWLALGLPPLVAIVAVHGPVGGMDALFADTRLMVEQGAALATAITAAAAAFASTVPGTDRRWLFLPLAPFGIWLLALGKGCLDVWAGGQLSLAADADCLSPMLLMAAVPAVAMMAMIRRGAPLVPRLTVFLGALATAAAVNFGLRFFHPGDATLTVLVWHMGFAAIASALATFAGPRMLRWR
jgi:hypothetical protein